MSHKAEKAFKTAFLFLSNQEQTGAEACHVPAFEITVATEKVYNCSESGAFFNGYAMFNWLLFYNPMPHTPITEFFVKIGMCKIVTREGTFAVKIRMNGTVIQKL